MNVMEDNAVQISAEGATAGETPGPDRVAAGRPELELAVASSPPSTNRGCFGPVTLAGDSGTGFIQFGVDYLRLTIFEPLEDVRNAVERLLLDPAAAGDGWQEKGPVGRWGRLLELPGADGYLVQLREPIKSQVTYTVVELKGEGCAYLQDYLQGFLRGLDAWASRWSCKRIDVKWDGHRITPAMMDEAVRAGSFVSRLLSVADRDWRSNFLGETAYLGNRTKPKHIRLYNARGFNRLELELEDDWAHALVGKLLVADLDDWSSVSVGFLLGTVDFRDVAAATRVKRAPRLQWWEEFVGAAEKVTHTGRQREQPIVRPLPIGLMDEWVKRNRKQLMKAFRALGPEWVEKRVRYWSAGAGEITLDSGEIVSDQQRQDVAQLALYRGSGLCGTVEEELPI